MVTRARWLLPDCSPSQAAPLAGSLGISLPAAAVLFRRGYRDAALARRFLEPSLDDLNDPFLMLGMREALERLWRAISGGEKILLYGDYDVDGTTSVVLMKKAIELAGGEARFYIPRRLTEGYGIHEAAIEQIAGEGTQLIVSLDTGIRAAAAVARARSLGVDVIVTDHHLPDAELPPASAVLNPKQPGCNYPEKELCGAGVAFKLVQALLGSLGWQETRVRRVTESFLKIVAIATIADVVPLRGENRVIVKHGLDGFRSIRNAGLRALLRVAGFADNEVPTAGQVAFRIAPRLNAAGRMADPNDIVNLLLSRSEEESNALAERLHNLNRERQDVQAEIVRSILDACLETPVTDDQAALVFNGRDWHRGVLGIVASRLVEQFHRPVFVLSEDAEGIAQGSGRSIPAFHLLEALESMPDLFLRFGGHRQAAGLTLGASRTGEFRERLEACAAARLSPSDFVPEIEVDATVSLPDLTDRAAAELLSFAPFGFGNPAPVFVALGAEVAVAPAALGDQHLRVTLRQNGRTLTLKAWNFAGRLEEFTPGARLDAVFSVEADDYAAARGRPGWCAVLKDIRPAAAAAVA